jgi:hypothetical protein
LATRRKQALKQTSMGLKRQEADFLLKGLFMLSFGEGEHFRVSYAVPERRMGPVHSV